LANYFFGATMLCMPLTIAINEHQREFFRRHVDTFEESSKIIRSELDRNEQNVDAIDQALGAIQHDLNTLRHAFAIERSAKNR
jgi:hypothetical protein